MVEGISEFLQMIESRFGSVGRSAVIVASVIWMSALILGGLVLNVIFLKWLAEHFVRQGLWFLLFILIGFGTIGVAGGVVHFILEKAFEWYKSRKG